MKKFLFLCLALCGIAHVYAQAFSFRLIVEDKDMNTDSVLLSISSSAMDSSVYGGGVNDAERFVFVLQSRTSDVWGKEATFANASGEYRAFKIAVSPERYPIRVRWESNLFEEQSWAGSFLTDWPEGCWFDCTAGWMPVKVAMNEESSAVLQLQEAPYGRVMVSEREMGVFYVSVGEVSSALESAPAEPSARLVLRDGHILVEREGAVYSIMGQQVE